MSVDSFWVFRFFDIKIVDHYKYLCDLWGLILKTEQAITVACRKVER